MLELNDNIHRFYENNDEDLRLKRTRVNNIEFLTTTKFLEKFCSSESNILDACAGTGIYSFHLANLGCKVTAGDLVDCNVEQIKQQQNDTPVLEKIYTGSTTDLSMFPDESFDVVLNLGSFYHLTDESDRARSMKESLRVLKPDGVYCLSYINKYANILKYRDKMTEDFDSFESYLRNGFNSDTTLFFASTPEDIEAFMATFKLKQLHNVATDGIKFITRDTVNSLNDHDFDKWMKIHLDTCEVKSILGYSEHALYIGRKQ